MAGRRKQRKLSKKETKALKKAGDRPVYVESSREPARNAVSISLPATVTVSDLSKLSGRTPAEIIGALVKNGVLASMNDSIDRETVEILAEELALSITHDSDVKHVEEEVSGEQVVRPPVVTILGHVDHGKTTLLDSIRETQVAAKESGGITQHIGAYKVDWSDKQGKQRAITFLDTPGHEAFSALRAHGATMTDIAILVVAADDGVKPQTKEALSHAKAANVPVIVALNKVDKPEANVDRVKAELVELGLQPEEWGGKTPVVAVSAKARTGIDDLLDTVLLVADLAELTARFDGPAKGVVIEAHKAVGVGPVATVLVQQGTLRVGDTIVVGSVYGKARLLQNEWGKRQSEAGPSTPIQVAGLTDVPVFGAQFEAGMTEKEARERARQSELRSKTASRTAKAQGVTQEGQLALILKADVDGSLKALRGALENIHVEGVDIRIIHEAVGQVTESDVHLAAASDAQIVAFHVGALSTARRLAEQHRILLTTNDVIYDLTDQVTALAQGAVKTERVRVEIGQFLIKAQFRSTKTHKIIGGVVQKGEVRAGAQASILRNGEVAGTATIQSVQRGQQTVEQIGQGEECGLGVESQTELLPGDILQLTVEEERIKMAKDEMVVEDVDNQSIPS